MQANRRNTEHNQSSGILDAYSIDPEVPLLWQKKWTRGNILDMKSCSINTKDHNKTATTTGLRDTRQKSETWTPDIHCPSGIIHHRSPSSIFRYFIHAIESVCVSSFLFMYVFLSFFFRSLIHSCHCTGLHVISLIHSFIYSFMHSFIHHDEI